MQNVGRKTERTTKTNNEKKTRKKHARDGATGTLISLVLLVSFISCTDAAKVWEQTQSIRNCEWSADETLLYTMPVDDTLTRFDLLFDLRNRSDYPYSNLYLFVTSEAPNGAFSVDTVRYILFDETGGRKGGGTISRFAENRFPFRTRIRFPVKGDYTVKIRHGMRDEILKGIASVGVRLEK